MPNDRSREARDALIHHLKFPSHAAAYLTAAGPHGEHTEDEPYNEDVYLGAVRDVSDALAHRDCGARLRVLEDGTFVGQLTGIVDLVEFTAATTADVWDAFIAAVEAYLGPEESA